MAGVHVYNDSYILDRRLSYKARGLLGYMLNQGKEWHVNVDELLQGSDEDGRIAVQSGLKELLKYGYAKLLTDRDKLGRVCGKHWVIYSTPTDKQETRKSGNLLVGTDKQETRLSENVPVGKSEIDVVTSSHRQAGFPLDGKPDSHKTCSIGFKDIETQDKTKDQTQDLTPPPLPPVEPPGEREGDVDTTAGLFNQSLQEQATEVLTYLKQITGMAYRSVTFIKAILGAGATVGDCKLMIDWWAQVWTVSRPEQRDLFDSATPFKKDIFEKNLPKAQKWHENGCPPPTAQQHHNGTLRQQERDRRNAEVEATARKIEEAERAAK